MPPRKIFTPCYDTRNHMEYNWTIGLVCAGHIYVKWTPGKDDKIISVGGYGGTGCL